MSEKLRKKKEGQEKNSKNQATNRGKMDQEAMKDKPSVHNEKTQPDSFDKDIKRTS